MIEILKAPPFATVQDTGFASGRAWGLPQSGAMDPWLLKTANRLVGNPAGCAAIEWTGRATFRCTTATRVAILGGAAVAFDGEPIAPTAVLFTAPAGVAIDISTRAEHRFGYLAVAGGLAAPTLLGSRSTYLPGNLGGWKGRLLASGDRLPLGKPRRTRGEAFSVTGAATLRVAAGLPDVELRCTRGPQWGLFGESAHTRFLGGRYTVSPASDRMGYRLEGPAVHPRAKATLPSEAACPGAVQIPDNGQPIVLMPDGPTVGGYPKLAVVIAADLRLLAQCVPARGVRFREVSLEAARSLYPEES